MSHEADGLLLYSPVRSAQAVQLVRLGECGCSLPITFPFLPSLLASRRVPSPTKEAPAGSYRPLSSFPIPWPPF